MARSVFVASASPREQSWPVRRLKEVVVRQNSNVAVIRSQKGFIFCGWNIESSFSCGREKEEATYGTISSRSPERNRIGTSVMEGR